jgi:hypothetical protein
MYNSRTSHLKVPEGNNSIRKQKDNGITIPIIKLEVCEDSPEIKSATHMRNKSKTIADFDPYNSLYNDESMTNVDEFVNNTNQQDIIPY